MNYNGAAPAPPFQTDDVPAVAAPLPLQGPAPGWSAGPNSALIGRMNVFGGNPLGDTPQVQSAGAWAQHSYYIPRAAQTTLQPLTT